jgi:alkanesulfonate monooxygenase SsuD/methylene tetrahydromethanopterin reductase-like flavin-dependent oxidoreductase (luciferase family)
MPAKRAIFVAPFEELSDPALLARLAARAEQRGFDGFFVWDHVIYSPPVSAVADPWVALAAIACATERVVIGPLVTPLARRRISKLARETATLDVLASGRTVFGAGLGGDRHGEFERFGDPTDPRERARLLDAGLDELQGYWREFEPRPVQPRIPIWLAARYPNRRPVVRAARFDGLFPIDLPGPEALEEMVAVAREAGAGDDFEVVAENRAGADLAPWEAAGATWLLTSFGSQPTYAEVEAAIDSG